MPTGSGRSVLIGEVPCKKCRGMFPPSFYSPDKRRKNGLQSYCKDCMREYGRRNYHKNRDRYFEVAKQRDIKLDALINSYKDVPCTDCGVRYPHYVMDFDHLRDKYMDISKMRKKRMAFNKIITEMEKCEVVCSNCHRERTNSRNPSRYTKGAF